MAAWAQQPAMPVIGYPSRPVRIIVGASAGGTTDISARLIGQWLSARLSQPFLVEHRPGGGTNIGAEAVVRAPADGYTLLLVQPAQAINATLYEKLNFDFIRDTTPVASLIRLPNVMEVNPAVPVKTVPEFIAYAKSYPAKISIATGGIGSSSHLSGELFKMMTGVQMRNVHYSGGAPAVADLLSGQVQSMFSNIPDSIEHIRLGKLRPLAVTTAMRSHVLPDVPTVSDFVEGYEVSSWQGVSAPRNTPAEIVGKLNIEINAGLVDPELKARFADLGAAMFAGSPTDFGKFVVEETEKWRKVIRAANIRAG
jgi:tripartite-type tricarboxylate transporter receptor subunit TctC